MRAICDHLFACKHPGCDMPPCNECGALCPNSTWKPEDTMQDLAAELQQLADHYRRASRVLAKYGDWVKA